MYRDRSKNLKGDYHSDRQYTHFAVHYGTQTNFSQESKLESRQPTVQLFCVDEFVLCSVDTEYAQGIPPFV